MKPFITRSALLLLSIAFVGCSSTQPTSPEASKTDTRPAEAANSSADHIDDPNEPAHGHSSSHDDSNEPPHRD